MRAHECDKHFVPILSDISYVEFQQWQPEWREAVGAANSISVPLDGVSTVLPRIVEGLEALGIGGSGSPGEGATAALHEAERDPLLIRTLTGHTGFVSACAISPDGSFIVSASWDSALKIWSPSAE